MHLNNDSDSKNRTNATSAAATTTATTTTTTTTKTKLTTIQAGFEKGAFILLAIYSSHASQSTNTPASRSFHLSRFLAPAFYLYHSLSLSFLVSHSLTIQAQLSRPVEPLPQTGVPERAILAGSLFFSLDWLLVIGAANQSLTH